MNKNYRVTIAHAVGSEDGGKTGKLGDQTGKEVRIQEWYASGGKWDAVIRCKNEANRLKIARNAEAGARNPLLGYSQPNRYTAYDQIKYKGYDYTKLDKPGDTDCSQMTTTNSSYAGYAIPRDTYTGNMLERYKATKAFKIYKSDKYTLGYKKLVPGDILLREGHHAATVINNIYWLKSILKKSPRIPQPVKDKKYKYLWSKAQNEDVIKKAWKNLRKGKTKREGVKAIEANFADEVKKMQKLIRDTVPEHPEQGYANIENASGDILDALAMEMDTPYYDNDLPIETKRELVEKTSPWHAKAGTTSAVEDLVATVFGEGNVEEWYEYNDVPYYFKIITNAQMVPDMVDEFNQMIKKAKNARSHLRTVEVRRTVEHPEYFVSGISATPHITITNNPQLARSIGEHTTQGMAAYATPHVSA